MKKLCIIYNTAPRYREAIFRMLDKEYDCDWYFGPTTSDIKEMDVSCLKNVRYYKISKKPYCKHGILRLLCKKEYSTFLYLAESRCLTDYLFMVLSYFFFPKKSVYIWTHGLYGKENYIEMFLKKWLFSHCDGVFLYGNYAKKIMVNKGMNPNKLFVIHNSLHYDQQLSIRKTLKPSDIFTKHFSNDHPVIVFIGRLTYIKRLEMIIDSLYHLSDNGEQYNLVFVGDGEARAELERRVEKYNIGDKVWFYGSSYDETTNAQLIYNADLCVAPGNVGLTAMHSMVFGCPVISHNDFPHQMPEFEAIKKGITGDFFNYGDTVSLSKTISEWFKKHKNDRDIVRKDCYNVIDKEWNPYFQIEIFKKTFNT